MELNISSYSVIKKNRIVSNDNLLYHADEKHTLAEFLNASYREINLAYPKFFKMDLMCKLGILASDIAIQNNPNFSLWDKNNTALFFANCASSLESDKNHVKSIENKNQYFPSPSVFVYTLPNIVIGEIAIKHKFLGENAFFISEKMDIDMISSYCEMAFKTSQTKHCIVGWVNVDGNEYEAFVFCIENPTFKGSESTFKLPFKKEFIQPLIEK